MAVQRVYEHAAKVKADAVFFLGDLFENKRSPRVDISSETYCQLFQLIRIANSKGNIKSILLSGNHDLYNGMCSLQPLKFADGAMMYTNDVSEAVPTYIINGVRLAYFPYGIERSVDGAEQDYHVAFLHHEIVGGKLSNRGIVSKTSGISESFLKKQGNRLAAFCGHYHNPQVIKPKGCVPVYCPGAPLAHNWSDVGCRNRGCIEADVDPVVGTVKVKRIVFNEFPRFFETEDKARDDSDFVRAVHNIRSEPVAQARVHAAQQDLDQSDVIGVIDAYVNSVDVNPKLSDEYKGKGKELLVGGS